MNDLDLQGLRRALQARDGAADQLDLTQLMARGRRLRRRRRVTAVAGGLCLAAVLAGTATVVADLTTAAPASVQPAGPGGQRPPASSAAPQPSLRPPTPRWPAQSGTPTPVPTASFPVSSPSAAATAAVPPTAASPRTAARASLATAVPYPTRSTTAGPSAPAGP